MTVETKRGRTADLPLEVRRGQETEKQRQVVDGLMRRHVADSEYKRRFLALQLKRVLCAGPALAAKLRGL